MDFGEYALVGLIIFKEGQDRALRAVRTLGLRLRKLLGRPPKKPPTKPTGGHDFI